MEPCPSAKGLRLKTFRNKLVRTRPDLEIGNLQQMLGFIEAAFRNSKLGAKFIGKVGKGKLKPGILISNEAFERIA